MVKNRHDDVVNVGYLPSSPDDLGVEVVALAELRQRLSSNDIPRKAERPEFHALLTVTEGVLWHMVDFQEFLVADDSWLWVRPGQVQRFGDLSDAEGTVVLFPSSTAAPALAAEMAVDDPFGPTLLSPDGEDRVELRRALDHLQGEFGSRSLPLRIRSLILQNLLGVLLLRLSHLTASASESTAQHDETFVEFRAAVERHFAEHRDVSFYAQQLKYSPRTLTRASQRAVGMGAKDFIDRRVVLEAKRMLVHSDDPVSAIAFDLGFDDTSNFAKYFALRTSLSPAAARGRLRGEE